MVNSQIELAIKAVSLALELIEGTAKVANSLGQKDTEELVMKIKEARNSLKKWDFKAEESVNADT
jgi:hypothetical protein